MRLSLIFAQFVEGDYKTNPENEYEIIDIGNGISSNAIK